MKRQVALLIHLLMAGIIMLGVSQQDALAQDKKEEKPAAPAEKKDNPAFLNAWKQIQSTVNKKRTSKTSEGVATAGVRGAEAEDQIVSQMYFKGGNNYPTNSKIKLAIDVLTKSINEAEDPASTAESRFYIAQCYIELGEKDKAIAAFKEISNVAPKSEWVSKAKDEIKKLEAK